VARGRVTCLPLATMVLWGLMALLPRVAAHEPAFGVTPADLDLGVGPSNSPPRKATMEPESPSRSDATDLRKKL
jgi:hypothetical protein